MTEARTCLRCIMDTSAKDIVFDQNGICHFCTNFFAFSRRRKQLFSTEAGKEFFAKIKSDGQGKKYDCIVGVSGGVDSSYVLLIAKKHGLRPLAVHFDNGWNSELAVSNIEHVTRSLGVDLYTHVVDWRETRGLQLSFMKADVIDVELIMDNGMLAVNYQMANKYGLKYILSGINGSTEGMAMPKMWNHYKLDVRNIRSINRSFENVRLRTQPLFSTLDYCYFRYVKGIEWVAFLDYLDYVKEDAINELKSEVGFRPYPYKHYESIFTRFYQGYILPTKFNADKRKVHFSNLICTGQMTREQAVAKIKEDPYPDPQQKKEDLTFVLKKLKLSEAEWTNYLARPEVPHDHYPTEEPFSLFLKRINKKLGYLRNPTQR